MCLIIALGLHLAPVGIIGLFLLVGLTSLKGVISEHKLGPAFEESLPFTALLVVFFAIVAVINDQALFTPIISVVLQSSIELQAPMFYIANGILSAISDNVFVATVYMNEIVLALENNVISREQFDKLAIAINTGTNLPSVATPHNGQAAFFVLAYIFLGTFNWVVLPKNGNQGASYTHCSDPCRFRLCHCIFISYAFIFCCANDEKNG